MDPIVCSLDEVALLSAFTKNRVRVDGRGFDDSKRVVCKLSPVSGAPNLIGSSQVQVGGTIVVCGITLMIGTPSTTRPASGDIGELLQRWSTNHPVLTKFGLLNFYSLRLRANYRL